MRGLGIGGETIVLSVRGVIAALLGLMMLALPVLAEEVDPGVLGSWRVSLILSRPGVVPVVLHVLGGAVVVVLVGNKAAGDETICDRISNMS